MAGAATCESSTNGCRAAGARRHRRQGSARYCRQVAARAATKSTTSACALAPARPTVVHRQRWSSATIFRNADHGLLFTPAGSLKGSSVRRARSPGRSPLTIPTGPRRRQRRTLAAARRPTYRNRVRRREAPASVMNHISRKAGRRRPSHQGHGLRPPLEDPRPQSTEQR
jgi:hypothetical protein